MDRIIGDRQIDAPNPGKPPLKVNAFNQLRISNTSLMPLFPYVSAGDIVPCATIFWGGENRDTSVFNHENSVDEVAITLAAAKSRLRAGFVHVGARKHLVGRYFEDPTDTEIMMAIVVTQRQAEEGIEQRETLTFICENCQEPLLTHSFNSKEDMKYAGADASGRKAALPGFTPPLETLTEGAIVIEPFNKDEKARTCPKCGTVNPPFPLHVWGWGSYYHNAVACERGRAILNAAGANS